MKRIITLALVVAAAALVAIPATASAAKFKDDDGDYTAVPGMQTDGPRMERIDSDGNGYPDAGVVVVGHYTSLYAYDDSGAYYWDLGDGRIYTSSGIGSVDDLDQDTLTTCTYEVNYKGTFENDPFQDSGHIDNHIVCSGYDGTGAYNYQIVHNTDPRYTGDGIPEFGGAWEYHVLTESGSGNVANPMRPDTAI
jgi:hypothetical protein